MKARSLFLIAAILAIASLVGASVASAHTRVDPTTLTPPLKPFRICYEDGPWVKCDTSTPTTSYANQANPDFDLPCGTIYESGTVTTHSTRWYKNLLLVERNAQEHIDGTWSLADGIRPHGRVCRGRQLARDLPRSRRPLERLHS